MSLTIEVAQEEDGRWMAEVVELSGVMVYGQSPQDAMRKAKSLALRVLADQIAASEQDDLDSIRFTPA
ncbi:MAG: type II toxin-antitoxin system HicB family antitoxin [Vulcanimicrobiota bacterium]